MLTDDEIDTSALTYIQHGSKPPGKYVSINDLAIELDISYYEAQQVLERMLLVLGEK